MIVRLLLAIITMLLMAVMVFYFLGIGEFTEDKAFGFLGATMLYGIVWICDIEVKGLKQ